MAARPRKALHPLVAKLTGLRVNGELNASETARRIGIRRENLWRYEHGVAVPGLEILTAWAAVYGLSVRID